MDEHEVDEILRRAGTPPPGHQPDAAAVLAGMRPRLHRARAAHRVRIVGAIGVVLLGVGGLALWTGDDQPAGENLAAGSADPTATESPTPPSPEPSARPASEPTQAASEANDGSVRIETIAGTIVVRHDDVDIEHPVEIEPAQGWTAEISRQKPARTTVRFHQGALELRVDIRLVDGALEWDIEGPEQPSLSPDAAGGTRPSGSDDPSDEGRGDDHDRSDEDDHEDKGDESGETELEDEEDEPDEPDEIDEIDEEDDHSDDHD